MYNPNKLFLLKPFFAPFSLLISRGRYYDQLLILYNILKLINIRIGQIFVEILYFNIYGNSSFILIWHVQTLRWNSLLYILESLPSPSYADKIQTLRWYSLPYYMAILSSDISKGRYSDGLCIQLKVRSRILSRFITLDFNLIQTLK